MKEVIKYIIGILVLVAGYYLGEFLRKVTDDEQKDGRKYFKVIVAISLVGVILGLILGKDWMLFTFALFAIVTSRSLK